MKSNIDKIPQLLLSADNAIDDEAMAFKVKNYWLAGKIAIEHKISTGQPVKNIANELNVEVSALHRCTQFYKCFKKGYPEKYYDRVVPWSLITRIIPVKNQTAREFYLKEACKNGWNRYELQRRIKEDYFNECQSTKGKNKKIKHTGCSLPYTYVAKVIRVVDADTLDLEIDVGFKTRQDHRVRLRGINAPEMSSSKGQKAKKFLEEELAKCVVEKTTFKGEKKFNPVVLVKTFKKGAYGRYIADIYYLPRENKIDIIAKSGRLLNQVLVDKGHASKI